VTDVRTVNAEAPRELTLLDPLLAKMGGQIWTIDESGVSHDTIMLGTDMCGKSDPDRNVDSLSKSTKRADHATDTRVALRDLAGYLASGVRRAPSHAQIDYLVRREPR